MSAFAAPMAAGAERRPRLALKPAISIVLGSVLLGTLAGSLVAGGHAPDLLALVIVFVVVAIWLRPQWAPVLLLLTGLLIEQFQIGLANSGVEVGVPITQSIPMFKGLSSFHLEPADLFPLVIFGIYMIRSGEAEVRWWPRTQLSLAVLALIGAVLFAEFNGMSHHGDIRESLFECRPFMYFGAAYLLTAVIVRTRSAVQALLWGIVIAEIIKALQGLDVWLTTRSFRPLPENVLGHEEALFFSLFFFLLTALWVFGLRGRLRTVATAAAPLVLFTDMVNDRRAAWLILPVGLVVLIAIAYRALPHRRRVLRGVVVVALFVTALYVPAYWNHTEGTLGKPDDAVRSQFSPTARDALSNQYRLDENANLKYNIKQDGILGAGFGQQINYALPMPGLVTAADAGITYVPHNTVLYLLMRMGILAGAFWAMLGAGIIAACRLARCPDRLFGAVGAIVAAGVVGWALMGAIDLGFTFPRIAIVMGCLLGLVEAARHIHATGQPQSARRGVVASDRLG